MSKHIFPMRDMARRRDMHGRGIRGPVISPTLPAWRTRQEYFDEFLLSEISTYRARFSEELDCYEYGVLEIPEHDPAPWEKGVPLARFIPVSDSAIRGRVIFYRKPLIIAASRAEDPRFFIHSVITEQIASLLNMPPEDIDFLG